MAAGATQYQDGSLTITTASDDILAGETITIEISTSGSGLIYPSVAFSDSSPYEWGVTLQGGTGKYARSIFGYLAPG